MSSATATAITDEEPWVDDAGPSYRVDVGDALRAYRTTAIERVESSNEHRE